MTTEQSPAGLLDGLEIQRRYTSSRYDLVSAFFRPCLNRSVQYDRAVGFFSSTFLSLVGQDFSGFAARGGRMRLVCCPQLSAADIEALSRGYDARTMSERALVTEIEQGLDDPAVTAASALLATLVGHGVLDLRVAFRPGNRGIYHDKVGIFTDSSGNRVAFDGSINESWSAWSGMANHEAFHAFTSWSPDLPRVKDDQAYFESLWRGEEPGLEVIPFPAVAAERLLQLQDPDGLAHAEEALRDALDRNATPTRRRPTLREHQRTVLQDWNTRAHRGLVEHATGSGKTITALTAVEEALDSGRPVLIVVPSVTLLGQWSEELNRFLQGECSTLIVGGGSGEWRRASNLRDFLEVGARPVVIATLDTAASDDFVSRLAGLASLFLVVDEVHNVGSRTRREVLNIDAEWRLGLSATWRREGDPEGTDRILAYFENVLRPVYTLADAVRDKHLCPYRLVLHTVDLTESEIEEWIDLSRRVGASLGMAGGEFTESVKQLLIKRARIVKHAQAKVHLAGDVLARYYEHGDAWLVYCEDVNQLQAVREALDTRGIACMEYHRRASGDEDAALAEFERSGGVMLAIRCLDEGVDIPRIDHALILASSTTRRQFIQRRGRVLRKAPGKWRAELHDCLVLPTGFDDPSSASFVRTEVSRAREFAESAVDSSAALALLDRIERELITTLGPGAVQNLPGFEPDDEQGEA